MFIENAAFIIEMFEFMTGMGYQFDGIFLFDDLGYKDSTLISPEHYKKLIFGADKLICEHAYMRNLKVILHSCGCVKGLISSFIDAGIDCLQPLEVKAGMDLTRLQNEYGNDMAFM